MKRIFLAIFSTIAISSHAQAPQWRITEVLDNKKAPAGYIMHSYAIGTQQGSSIEKIAAGLRLVCSSKSPADPVMGVFWNSSLLPEQTQTVTVWVDGKLISSSKWTQDGAFVYAAVSDIPAVIKSVKTGKLAKFSWTAKDSIPRSVIFDLEGVNFESFNLVCRSNI